jgi:hypothetical protein
VSPDWVTYVLPLHVGAAGSVVFSFMGQGVGVVDTPERAHASRLSVQASR